MTTRIILASAAALLAGLLAGCGSEPENATEGPSEQPAAQAKGIVLAAVLQEGPIELLADRRRLTQVVLNVLGNARKYTPYGGTVFLKAGEEANEVVIRVEDSGIGIAPGANIGGAISVYEATHGTAPKYAGQDKVNPGSIILSAEMMLRDMGWVEAADLIIKGISGAIEAKTVTYDFERLMPNATLLRCSEFGEAIIANME